MQMNTKLKTLTKPIGTSHEKKKTMLTKTTTPLVLKLLAALCMLDCVGAQYETDRTAQNAQRRLNPCPKGKKGYLCPVDQAGMDAALCTVEAIGKFGYGALYGNYTEDHFVLDPATGNVAQHGKLGNRTVEDKYDVMTSCPVGLDEAGTGFTPLDGGFCGESTSEMAWSDYLLIHASILRIVRATGGYWFSASAYDDIDSVMQHGPELCAAMLACAGAGTECNELERICALFIHGHYLSDDAHEATLKAMPDIGEVGAPGSVSFVVSEGKVSTTEYIVLVAAGVLAGAAVVAALLMAAVVARTVHRRKRSPPTPVTVELEPGTLKLEPTAVA